MDKRVVKDELMRLGFPVSVKGFDCVIKVLECIDKEGADAKITWMYADVAKKKNTTYGSVERSIRHLIKIYYDTTKKPHPELVNDARRDGRFTNKEFLARLYKIIYEGYEEAEEAGEDEPEVTSRNLCGVYFVVKRRGKYRKVCFSDMTEREMETVLSGKSEKFLKSLCYRLGGVIHELGESFDIERVNDDEEKD